MLKVFEQIGHDYYLDIILEPRDFKRFNDEEVVDAEIKLGTNTLYIGIRGFEGDYEEDKSKRKKK